MILNKYRCLLPLIIMFSSSAVYAEIYKCKNTNGNVTYSEKPCADKDKNIELKLPTPTPSIMSGYAASHIVIGGKYYTAEVYHEKVNHVTKWRKGRGNPPIDKSKANSLASAKLSSMFPSITWITREITLDYTDQNKGYYSVTLENVNNEKDGAILFVLMNGEVSKIKSAELKHKRREMPWLECPLLAEYSHFNDSKIHYNKL